MESTSSSWIAPPIPATGRCPLCGGHLDYFFRPVDSFACPTDAVWWSLAEALDHRPGHRENL